jgi:hypothetical protein
LYGLNTAITTCDIMFRPSIIEVPASVRGASTTVVDGVRMTQVQQTEVGGGANPGCGDNLGTGCYCDVPDCGLPRYVAVPDSTAPPMLPNFVFRTLDGETVFTNHYTPAIPDCGNRCLDAMLRGQLSGLQPIIGEFDSVLPKGTY